MFPDYLLLINLFYLRVNEAWGCFYQPEQRADSGPAAGVGAGGGVRGGVRGDARGAPGSPLRAVHAVPRVRPPRGGVVPSRPAPQQLSSARLGAARHGMAWLLLLAGAALLAPAAASEVTAEGKWALGGSARLGTAVHTAALPELRPRRSEPCGAGRSADAARCPRRGAALQGLDAAGNAPGSPGGAAGWLCGQRRARAHPLPPAARAALRGGRIRAAAAGLRGQQTAHRGAQRREQLLPEYERRFSPSPPSFCFRFGLGLR